MRRAQTAISTSAILCALWLQVSLALRFYAACPNVVAQVFTVLTSVLLVRMICIAAWPSRHNAPDNTPQRLAAAVLVTVANILMATLAGQADLVLGLVATLSACVIVGLVAGRAASVTRGNARLS